MNHQRAPKKNYEYRLWAKHKPKQRPRPRTYLYLHAPETWYVRHVQQRLSITARAGWGVRGAIQQRRWLRT